MHHEKLHNSYSAPNIIKVIKSRRVITAYVARIGEVRNVYNVFWLESLKGRDYLRDQGVDGSIILR
jgi:hypothetical protein